MLDASAVVDLIAGTGPSGAIREALRGRRAHAPHFIDGEVLSALARLVRAGRLSEAQAELGVAELDRIPLERHGHALLAPAAWRTRTNIRVTDGLYVELARSLELALLTSDARLARAVEQRRLCRLAVPEVE